MGGIHDKAEFEALVDSLLAASPVGSFGRLHVITLAEPRDDPEWSRKLPKIRAISESILEARLASDETFFPGAPGQYLLVFPRLGETEGAVRAAALAREIRRRLFGETGRDLEVTARVVPLARLKSGNRPEVAAMEAALDAPPKGQSQHHGIVLDAMFQPVWNALGEAVIGNRETIRRIFEGREIYGPAVLFGGNEDPLAIEVNAVLRKASQLAAPLRATLFLPQVVNALVLQDLGPMREWVADIARLHPGKLVIELAGGVAVAGRPGLRALIRAIRDHGAEVAVQVVPDGDLARALHDFGVRYLCINEAQVRAAGLSPSAILALFTVVAHEVRNVGLQLCLWNVRTPQEIKRAIPLGFRHFTGDAIGETAKLPAATRARPVEQVFA